MFNKWFKKETPLLRPVIDQLCLTFDKGEYEYAKVITLFDECFIIQPQSGGHQRIKYDGGKDIELMHINGNPVKAEDIKEIYRFLKPKESAEEIVEKEEDEEFPCKPTII